MTSALFIWSFIQSFIIGGIISLVKRTTINYILSGIFITMSINILFQYIYRRTDLKYKYAQYVFLPDVLDFLLPVLIFWYVNYLLGKKLTIRHYRYFLPTIISLLFLLTYVAATPDFAYRDYIGTTLHKIVLLALVLWKVFVFYKLYILLKAEEIQPATKHSFLFRWLRVLMIFVGIMGYIALVQLVHLAVFVPYLEAASVARIRILVQLNYILFNSSIILFTIYYPLKYPKILLGEPIIKPKDTQVFPEGPRYTEKLSKLIEEDQVHLNSELNEKALADQMGIQPYVLSRLLNEHLGKSFSEFINEKRIESAQKMLKDDQCINLTNLAISADSGFRSESVFYVNFKKITGMTPTQYKKSFR